MKKIGHIIILCMITVFSVNAQTEISGYADADPTNGINDGTAITYSIDEAVVYCRDMVEDGKDDWYLPSGEELMLFIPDQDECNTSPGCVSSAADCEWVASRYHYTRTLNAIGYLAIYTYCSSNNLTYTHNASTAYYVRCVR